MSSTNQGFENDNGESGAATAADAKPPTDDVNNAAVDADGSLPPKYDDDAAAEHHSVNMSHQQEEELIPDKPYSGMNKEDLLRFSDTPFWNNLRFACFVSQLHDVCNMYVCILHTAELML